MSFVDDALRFSNDGGFIGLEVCDSFGDAGSGPAHDQHVEAGDDFNSADFAPLDDLEPPAPRDKGKKTKKRGAESAETGAAADAAGEAEEAATVPKQQKNKKQKKEKKEKAAAVAATAATAAAAAAPAGDAQPAAAEPKKKKHKTTAKERRLARQAKKRAAAATDGSAPATAVAAKSGAAGPSGDSGSDAIAADPPSAAAASEKAAAKAAAKAVRKAAWLERTARQEAEAEAAAAAAEEAAAERAAQSVATGEAASNGWDKFGLHADIVAKLAAAGFTEPTPIQRATLPAALQGRRDIVGAAETGSGKTLAFGLPIMHRLLERQRQLPAPAARGAAEAAPLFALIVCPTRELALQVTAHLQAVAPAGARVVPLVGGMSIEKQRRQLSLAPEVVVGTPGRLWELVSDATCPHLGALHKLRFFVLDEVDRMVEAGHFKELQNILRLLEQTAMSGEEPSAEPAAEPDAEPDAAEPAEPGAASRQTLLFSATLMLPPNAREANAKRLASRKPLSTDSTMDKLLRMVVFRQKLKVVDLSRPELVARGLSQAQLSCTHDQKDALLFLLLRTRMRTGRTIVFTNAITALQRLRSLLALLEVNVIALQGNMQQRARIKALERFKASAGCVLLATDVAARGLDIEAVDFVVHYQMPRSAEVYVHRSGRTARGSKEGLAVALVEPAEQKVFERLCAELGTPGGLEEQPIERALLPKVKEVVSLASRLDKAAHLESSAKARASTQRKLAQEMDLPTDSDDSDDEATREDEAARRAALRKRAEAAQMREKLKWLLGRIERPSGGVPVHEVAGTWS